MAIEGLYRPIWSAAILDELVRVEADKRLTRGAEPEQARDAAQWLIEQMRRAFDDACVAGWEPLVGSYRLPDPDDEHLVAAAVVGGAGAIVTSNARDLPTTLLPTGIEVVSPAEFAASTVSVAPSSARRALAKISARYVDPRRTEDELLDILRDRYGMNEAVELLRR